MGATGPRALCQKGLEVTEVGAVDRFRGRSIHTNPPEIVDPGAIVEAESGLYVGDGII